MCHDAQRTVASGGLHVHLRHGGFRAYGLPGDMGDCEIGCGSITYILQCIYRWRLRRSVPSPHASDLDCRSESVGHKTHAERHGRQIVRSILGVQAPQQDPQHCRMNGCLRFRGTESRQAQSCRSEHGDRCSTAFDETEITRTPKTYRASIYPWKTPDGDPINRPLDAASALTRRVKQLGQPQISRGMTYSAYSLGGNLWKRIAGIRGCRPAGCVSPCLIMHNMHGPSDCGLEGPYEVVMQKPAESEHGGDTNTGRSTFRIFQ